MVGFGSFWLVLLVVVGGFGWFWLVLAGFGWFWVVLAGFGWFHVLVTTNVFHCIGKIFFKDKSKHFPQVFCRNRRVIFVKVVVCCAHSIPSSCGMFV